MPRIVERRLLELASHFPVVLVTGARQAGKSTLVSRLFGESAKMFVFDPVHDLYGSRSDPELFLEQTPPPLILDEVQYAQELLPGIKRRVDAQPGPGQYILTGSQNLALLKGVAESLAGRVAVLDLEPMTGLERQGLGTAPGWLASWLSDPEGFLQAPSEKRHGENLYRALRRMTAASPRFGLPARMPDFGPTSSWPRCPGHSDVRGRPSSSPGTSAEPRSAS